MFTSISEAEAKRCPAQHRTGKGGRVGGGGREGGGAAEGRKKTLLDGWREGKGNLGVMRREGARRCGDLLGKCDG